MWGILLSAANYLLGFLIRGVIAKFFIFFGLFFVVSEFIPVLQSAGIIPTVSTLNGAFGGLSSGFWYFADLTGVNYGLPLVISAYVSRFIIRRIPFIN